MLWQQRRTKHWRRTCYPAGQRRLTGLSSHQPSCGAAAYGAPLTLTVMQLN